MVGWPNNDHMTKVTITLVAVCYDIISRYYDDMSRFILIDLW